MAEHSSDARFDDVRDHRRRTSMEEGLRTEYLGIATWGSLGRCLVRYAQGSWLGRRRLSRTPARNISPECSRRDAKVRQMAGTFAIAPTRVKSLEARLKCCRNSKVLIILGNHASARRGVRNGSAFLSQGSGYVASVTIRGNMSGWARFAERTTSF